MTDTDDEGAPAFISIKPMSAPLASVYTVTEHSCAICLRPVGPRHLHRLPARRERACTTCIAKQAQQAEHDRVEEGGDEAAAMRTRVRLDQWLRLPREMSRQLLAGRYQVDPVTTGRPERIGPARGGESSMTYVDPDGLPSSVAAGHGDHLHWAIPWNYWDDYKAEPDAFTPPRSPQRVE